MRKAIRYSIVVLFLVLSGCISYHPAFFPGYDILNPNLEVRINPIAWIDNNEIVNDDGERIVIVSGIIVNEAYILWTYDLKAEIIRLRILLEEN